MREQPMAIAQPTRVHAELLVDDYFVLRCTRSVLPPLACGANERPDMRSIKIEIAMR